MAEPGRALHACPSCAGYGWFADETGASEDCDWCAGVGYVWRDARGLDARIQPTEYGRVAARLEQLEAQRLRELGYTGRKRPRSDFFPPEADSQQ